MMSKIIWWSSAPWERTVFGKNTLYTVKTLRNVINTDMVVVARRGLQGRPTTYQGIKVLPQKGKKGFKTVNSLYETRNFNLVVQHFPRWQMQYPIKSYLPLLSYSPVSYKPLSPAEKNFCKVACDIIAPSRYSQEVIEESGFKNTYIPYGVDTLRYSPTSDARKQLDFPEDKFLFGQVAPNIMNKENIVNQLLAYRKFIDEVGDSDKVHYFLVTNPEVKKPRGPGLPILQFIKVLDIKDKVTVLRPKLTEKEMNLFYNAMDVMMNASMGESFGLATAEAMSTKTPVIGSDCTTMPQLIGEKEERGWLADVVDKDIDPRLHAWRYVPSTESVKEKMLHAYNNPDVIEKKGVKARLFIQENYDIVDVCEEQWEPYLREQLQTFEPHRVDTTK